VVIREQGGRKSALLFLLADVAVEDDVSAHSGARLCEPQHADDREAWKLVPASILPATRCGSQTRAPAETGDVWGVSECTRSQVG